jgi:hypothetical protein
MNAIRKTLTAAGGLALVLMLGACGEDPVGCAANPTSPECRPSPSPSPTPRPAVVIAGGSGSLPVFTVLIRNIATTETGTFDITVDWTFATNDVDVALARGSCSFDQLIGDQCTFVGIADSVTTKPERLHLTNQPAGQYTLVVPNFGPADESIAYQVVFTPGASAASASRGSVIPRPDKFLGLLRVAKDE